MSVLLPQTTSGIHYNLPQLKIIDSALCMELF